MDAPALVASATGWLVLGAVLVALEALVPGVFLIWFGLAALATGAVLLAVPLGAAGALLAFAAFSAAFVLLARSWLGPRVRSGGEPLLNRRAEALVGRELTLREAIVDGEGRASADDVLWRVTGPALPAGARVRVTGTQGTRLVVGPAGGDRPG